MINADLERFIMNLPTGRNWKCQATITQGDVVAVSQTLDANTFDACFFDGPYGLTSIGKRFGKRDSKPPRTANGPNGAYGRMAAGFMGQTWDGDVPTAEACREFLRVCKPGAWMLAFGHPRTFHRLMCNIEEAGWDIRDTLMWLYGQGFPKSHDLGKKMDDAAWNGYGYALKPAYEPIIVAMKPLDRSFGHNARAWGVGGLNINGCRIPRYPANVALDEEAARLLDLQSPIAKGGKFRKTGERNYRHKGQQLYGGGIGGGKQNAPDCYGDAGGRSRFFYCPKASKHERNAGLENFPIDRPDGRTETGMGFFKEHGIQPQQNQHPCVKPIALNKWLATLILPPERCDPRKIFIPYSGSGSEMVGAMLAGWDEVLGIEWCHEYVKFADARIKRWRSQQ